MSEAIAKSILKTLPEETHGLRAAAAMSAAAGGSLDNPVKGHSRTSRRPGGFGLRSLQAVVVAALLVGCAAYQSVPLASTPSLLHEVPRLVVDARDMPLPELAAHRFANAGGLDIDDVAMLAVVNNPDLKVARRDAGVAHAQAFAARLLPDLQFSFSRDLIGSNAPGAVPAFSSGLAEDVNALIRHRADRRAAADDARKVDLGLLWQEWQIVARARLLFVKLLTDERLSDVIERNRTLFLDRYRRTQTALGRGLLTLDAVTPHLTALQDVERQRRDLERQLNTDRHDLNALLGLAPEVPVPLYSDSKMPPLDESQVLSTLADLPRRRPDLIALQYGFRAEDWRLRAALLGRFPTFTVGFTRARDSSGLYTAGLGINLSLPVFNGNRGNIAIEQATRERLRLNYQARLDAAYGDVHRILAEQRINRRQLVEVEDGLAALSGASEKAELAFRSRNIDALVFANLQATLLAKQIERINLELAILQQRIALQTLAGGELPGSIAHEIALDALGGTDAN